MSENSTKTAIYYYTGTGNSLWIARQLADHLGGAELRPMKRASADGGRFQADVVGLVFPVHSWGVPAAVIEFLKSLEGSPDSYYFACAVNAGQVSRTLLQLSGLMKRQGLSLSGGFDIAMPSNYIPWGGPGTQAHRDELGVRARGKVEMIADYVSRRETGVIEKGPLWQRVVFTPVYKVSSTQFARLDGSFWVDDRCNECGTCARVCPARNIVMSNGRPEWQHGCEQCLACLQWCPREAIQYGKKTPGLERYHHPGVALKDMVAAAGSPDDA